MDMVASLHCHELVTRVAEIVFVQLQQRSRRLTTKLTTKHHILEAIVPRNNTVLSEKSLSFAVLQ